MDAVQIQHSLVLSTLAQNLSLVVGIDNPLQLWGRQDGIHHTSCTFGAAVARFAVSAHLGGDEWLALTTGNAEFIAESRTLLPQLARAVEELEAKLSEKSAYMAEQWTRVVTERDVAQALNERLVASLHALLPWMETARWHCLNCEDYKAVQVGALNVASESARALLAETENT